MALSISFLAAVAVAGAAPAPCTVERGVYQLDVDTFDQDPVRGWRALAERPECREKAIEVMSRYRLYAEARLRSLLWHEAQVRADAGDTATAIDLMAKARHEAVEHGTSQEDWNAYVDATIAFLRGDRAELLRARDRLASYPWPPGYKFIDEKGVTHTSKPATWPMDLDAVDRLIGCFGRPYAEAYRTECASSGPAPDK